MCPPGVGGGRKNSSLMPAPSYRHLLSPAAGPKQEPGPRRPRSRFFRVLLSCMQSSETALGPVRPWHPPVHWGTRGAGHGLPPWPTAHCRGLSPSMAGGGLSYIVPHVPVAAESSPGLWPLVRRKSPVSAWLPRSSRVHASTLPH